MSYRAFKRLLGETSLERKCRFLFGIGVFVLIWLSFWFYAYQTEHLAYDQAVLTCRMLVTPSLAQHHLIKIKSPGAKPAGNLESIILAAPGREYQYHFLSVNFDDSYDTQLYKEFRGDAKTEDWRLRANDQVLLYYAP